jgi:2-polyprenyl-3-methyl-5-hydroxy-6-metoxy-1,4-benzoquinol methylase
MSIETLSTRLLPSIVQPPTIVFNPPGGATPGELAAMACPNCGNNDPKTLVLTVDVQLPDNPSKRLRVLHCPGCTAHFYDSQIPPDYAEPALNNRGRVPFYVQQGAGVSLITRPLAQLRLPPGSSYMEIGCGYGFGLDFALNTKGWKGVGIDPAPLAALGRDALGLPIELRYLRDDDEARGTMDVVMGSEVIEHVTSPKAFVRTLRAMLKPGGVMVLTTPNGNDIDPETPPGIIIPLLSPSLHLVIQNQRSLRTLLEQSGFQHVEVVIDSHSLVAFASDSPLDLEEDRTTLRRALREHLGRRAAAADPAGDPFIGFAARAFTESINDDDMTAADRAWALLVPACRSRYGFSLDALTTLPDSLQSCSLEDMARLVPLNLGGLLYARAIRSLAAGTPRPQLETQFLLAAQACGAMRRALGELAMEDGQTEDIGWTAQAEALLCAIEADTPDAITRLARLPIAPNGGAERKQQFILRAMTNLVNAGKYVAARTFVATFGLETIPFVNGTDPLTEVQRDALFCMAILDVEIGPDGRCVGRPVVGRSRLKRVRAASEPGSPIWWAALRAEAQAMTLLGDRDSISDLAERVWSEQRTIEAAQWAIITLVNAGRYDPARKVATESGLKTAPFSQPGITRAMTDQERDAVFALAVLDVQTDFIGRPIGEPAMARGRFARVRAAGPAGSGLWFAALRGELQALDQLDARNEAASLAADLRAAHAEVQFPPDILSRIGKA